jgi:hypothetical protein
MLAADIGALTGYITTRLHPRVTVRAAATADIGHFKNAAGHSR